MKRLLGVLTVVALVTGCASNPMTKVEQTQNTSVKAQNKFETDQPPAAKLSVPNWFIQPPEMTQQSIFSAGEATGNSLSMTMHKAMLDADAKLAFTMKSMIKSMAKSYRTENGKYGAENSELLIRKITNSTIVGHHQVDSHITQEGRQYRVFVLMRYPLGDANKLLQEHIATTMQQQNARNSKEALKELNEGLRGDDEGVPQSQVKSVVVPDKTISLLDVNNEEYKKKRDEALQKPGAVIGQITVR